MIRGMKHELLALSGFYLGAWMLWTTGRMLKADLGISKAYTAAECLLYFVTGIFAFILFLWWLSTTYIQRGVSEIAGWIAFFTGAWLAYKFIRVVILGGK